MNLEIVNQQLLFHGLKSGIEPYFKGMQPFTSLIGRLRCATQEGMTRRPNSVSQCWVHGHCDHWYVGLWTGELLRVKKAELLLDFLPGLLGLNDSFVSLTAESIEHFGLDDASDLLDDWTYMFFASHCSIARLEETEKSRLPPPFNKGKFIATLQHVAQSLRPIPHNGILFSYKSAEGMIRFSPDDEGCSGHHPIVFRSSEPGYSEDQLLISQLLAEQLNCVRFDAWRQRMP